MEPLWTILVLYAFLDLTAIYTYQFSHVREVWIKALNSSHSHLSTEEMYVVWKWQCLTIYHTWLYIPYCTLAMYVPCHIMYYNVSGPAKVGHINLLIISCPITLYVIVLWPWALNLLYDICFWMQKFSCKNIILLKIIL